MTQPVRHRRLSRSMLPALVTLAALLTAPGAGYAQPDEESCASSFVIRPGAAPACQRQDHIVKAFVAWVEFTGGRVPWSRSSLHATRREEPEALGLQMIHVAAHNVYARHSWEDLLPATWFLVDGDRVLVPLLPRFGHSGVRETMVLRDLVACQRDIVPSRAERCEEAGVHGFEPEGCWSMGPFLRDKAPLDAPEERFERGALDYLGSLLALVVGPGRITEISLEETAAGGVFSLDPSGFPSGSAGFGHDGPLWYDERPVHTPLKVRREAGRLLVDGLFRVGQGFYRVSLRVGSDEFVLRVETIGRHETKGILEI